MRTLIVPALIALAVLATPAMANPPPPTADNDPSAKRITGSENYIPTFGLRASISRGFSVQGVLSVDAGLDVPQEKSRKKVEALKPRLMAGMREAVLNYASLGYIVGERPDADIIRIRLQKVVDGVIGAGEAKVTLASVIVFPQ